MNINLNAKSFVKWGLGGCAGLIFLCLCLFTVAINGSPTEGTRAMIPATKAPATASQAKAPAMPTLAPPTDTPKIMEPTAVNSVLTVLPDVAPTVQPTEAPALPQPTNTVYVPAVTNETKRMSEYEYAVTMTDILNKTGAAGNEMARLINLISKEKDIVMEDSFKTAVATQAIVFRDQGRRLQEIVPPDSLRSVHAYYSDAAPHMIGIWEKCPQALETLEPTALGECMAEVNMTAALMSAGNDELKRVMP